MFEMTPRSLFPVEDEFEVHASPEPASFFVEIVFDRPMDHAYTYAVPDRLAAQVAVGKRVEAPFGRGDRGIPGFCVRVASEAPTRAVKSILRVLDDDALVDDHLMKLTRWMADYYLCGWGQVLHALVPAGVRENAGTRQAIFLESLPPEALPNPLPTVSPQQKIVLDRLKLEARAVEQGQLCRLAKASPAVVGGLVKKGLIRKFTERIESNEATDDTSEPSPHIEMNADQLAAWEPVHKALASGGGGPFDSDFAENQGAHAPRSPVHGFQAFLLHGVTGSGKTEVYLRAIEEVVRQGKEAIVLVPEISLTPQTIARFRGRCGNVAVLHSHLTDAERGAYWRRVAAGSIQVVVGARSAVFAPTRKLGLIVIDEEHEHTFKQESTPRYHARDVAIMRARLENIPILMGSATPSLESWHNAQRGNFTLLKLPKRVEERPMPPVKLVDLRHEPKTPGKHFAIGPTLERAMRENLKAGGQVILLLNRRGFSTHVHCPACGHVAQCAHCDLSLTFHRKRSALVCHYCGWETPPFHSCPACGDGAIRYQGLGTEKLQTEIESKFPSYVCQRMDSDTMTRPGSHEKTLDAFRAGNIQILLGTQMIAKGLDFPNVTLVGVVNADTGLHLPDFRSAERTFQLLAQVAGRTGRGDKGGHVMVQTLTPEHPCIALAAKHAYVPFAAQELAHRKEHKYPPFERMARLIVRSENEEAAEKFSNELAGAFQEAIKRVSAEVRLLGPAECPVFKLKNHFRFHFQVQSASSGALHDAIRTVLAIAKPPNGVEFQVDVDPYNML
jgi:primosomal protein N' (replication factor Y)